ncbi:hypothetical protein DIPPA_31176 [Diplonema papillatum]|nr:hypothetical protein DIPPA_31176 [Diplonema papillatum]
MYAASAGAYRKGLQHCLKNGGNVVVVVGQGMSREAGIEKPNWSIGDMEYPYERMRTHVSFKRMWWEVWAWMASRASAALVAEPTSGYRAVVDLLVLLGRRANAVSTSSDGLLRRAAVDAVDYGAEILTSQVVELNGNVTTMRCCHPQSPHPHEDFPLPELESVGSWTDFINPARRRLTQDEVRLLRCPLCLSPARPSETFLDEDLNALAASRHLQQLAREPTVVLLLGCDAPLSPFERSLLQATRLHGGWVIRVGCREPAQHGDEHAADPANALGQTGIRDKDDIQYFAHPANALLSPGRQPDSQPEVMHIGMQLSGIVDVTEELLKEHQAMPPSYQRLSI